MSRPAPFIVGAPRSGTTLLRLMLDSHSEIAIPPETGFIQAVRDATGEGGREAFWRTLTGYETWPDFHLDPEALRRSLLDVSPFDVSGGLRAFYGLYAARFGKPGWGDKTPSHAFCLPLIRELLPESFFIHLVRDGRDVALSQAGLWFSPGEAIEARAVAWRRSIEAFRAQRLLGGCLEVRYEDLVLEPRAVLTTICEHLGVPFEDAMADYHLRAPDRLQEHQGRFHPDGSVRLSKSQRLAQQHRTRQPPDSSRIGRWRRELPQDQLRRFEAVAGDTLRLLCYETLG